MKKLYTKKSSIHGKGIYTASYIKKGEFIAFIEGKKVRHVSSSKEDARKIDLYYGISKSTWLDPGKNIWRFFNHSCDPNTAIVGTKKLIALKNIKPNEEIFFDYSMTDGDLFWEMPCKCGAKNCRKIITSIQRIDDRTYKNHLPFIPLYFQKLRERYKKNNTI